MTLPLLQPCGTFHCDLPTAATILHLSEAEVWTLIVGGQITPVAKTRDGGLVFDATRLKPSRKPSAGPHPTTIQFAKSGPAPGPGAGQ